MALADEIAGWLADLKHQDVVPVRVEIGEESWWGAEYTYVGRYTRAMGAVQCGDKKDGEEYRARRIYLAGLLPKTHKHSTERKTGTVYLYNGDRKSEWYVTGYYQGSETDSERERVAGFHPFGKNWALGLWDLPEPIDKYDAKPAPRREMIVTPSERTPCHANTQRTESC